MRARVWTRATVLLLLCCGIAVADSYPVTFEFKTPTGATEPTSNRAVSSWATFTITAAGKLHVVLQNLLVNPTAVTQLLSNLFFQVDSGLTSATLTSSLAEKIDVNSNGSWTVVSNSAPTGWIVQRAGNRLDLCDINCGAAGPSNLLIGPPGSNGLYSNANSSIAGNGPHNPFLAGPAVFDLNITGITASSKVTNVTFGYGTSTGDYVSAVPVPEPSGLLLLLTCVLGIGLICRHQALRRNP
jgi:hypothetical protein